MNPVVCAVLVVGSVSRRVPPFLMLSGGCWGRGLELQELQVTRKALWKCVHHLAVLSWRPGVQLITWVWVVLVLLTLKKGQTLTLGYRKGGVPYSSPESLPP